MTQISFRDVEQLSALLDEKLSLADVARLQKRLETDPELREIYEDLRQTRSLLHKLPQRRAPRNFTLKPAAAKVRPPLPQAFPLFRLASALASILLLFSLATNAALPRLSQMTSSAPIAYGVGGGGPEVERFAAENAAQDAAMPEEPAAAPAAKEPSQKFMEPTLQAPALAAPAEELPVADPTAEPLLIEEPAPHIESAPIPPPLIPTWAVGILGMLALISGLGANYLRWNTDKRWKQKQQQIKKKGG